MSDTILLRTYPDAMQADLVRTFLESQGILTVVEDSEKFHTPSSVYGQNIFPAELRVAETDYATAEALLQQSEAGLFAIDENLPAQDYAGEPESGSE